jgi:hypothetical protein
MNKKTGKLVLVMLVIASLMALPLLSGCAEEGNGNGENREIVIGTLLDFSGPAGVEGRRSATFWEDMARYINEEDPIPGITLKMISYDNEYDPAKTMIGYRYLLDRGAMAIMGQYPHDAEILKSRLARDKVPMYISGPSENSIDPPGWVFAISAPNREQISLALQWLSAEGWDYEAMGRKPKIGIFGWNDTHSLERVRAAKEWVQNNPDEFEWMGEEIGPMGTVSWLAEATRLKDADYLIMAAFGSGLITFVNEARAIGFKGDFIIGWAQVSHWEAILEGCGSENLDGTIFPSEQPLWFEENLPSVYVRTVVEKYHPDMVTEMLSEVANDVRIIAEIIGAAAEQVGVENVDGEAIYKASLNMRFPEEISDVPDMVAGFNTERPERLQRQYKPSARMFEYRADYEYEWFKLTDLLLYPTWEGVVI